MYFFWSLYRSNRIESIILLSARWDHICSKRWCTQKRQKPNVELEYLIGRGRSTISKPHYIVQRITSSPSEVDRRLFFYHCRRVVVPSAGRGGARTLPFLLSRVVVVVVVIGRAATSSRGLVRLPFQDVQSADVGRTRVGDRRPSFRISSGRGRAQLEASTRRRSFGRPWTAMEIRIFNIS